MNESVRKQKYINEQVKYIKTKIRSLELNFLTIVKYYRLYDIMYKTNPFSHTKTFLIIM